ncbi:MAG: hypothetical protein ACREAU_01565 [Nitrosopumilaceae archaeon]
MNQNKQLSTEISANNMFKTYLTQCDECQYVITVHEQFAHHVIKKWIVFKNRNRWYIKNHQLKAQTENDNPLDMEYEWRIYPINFRSLKGLISTFTEITNNFTYFFIFPKEEIST